MKKYVFAAVAVVLLLTGSSAYAGLTVESKLEPAEGVYPGLIGAIGKGQSGGGSAGGVATDAAADAHAASNLQGGDYRLSCPHLSPAPTVDSCRTLALPQTFPY